MINIASKLAAISSLLLLANTIQLQATQLMPGELMVATRSGTTQTFWSLDPETGTKTQHGSSDIGTYNNGMGFSNGNFYVAQDQSFRVLNVDYASGTYSELAVDNNVDTNFGNIRDMTVANDGGLWVLTNSSYSRIDPITGDQSPYYPSTYYGPGGLLNPRKSALEQSGLLLRTYIGSQSNTDGGITRFNPDTGEETVLRSGMANPTNIAVSDDGSIYVTERNYDESIPSYHGIHRIDPVSGTETIVSTNSLLRNASGLIWSPTTGGLITYDYFSGSVYEVDITDGSFSRIAQFDSHSLINIAVVPIPEISATPIPLFIAAIVFVLRRRRQK